MEIKANISYIRISPQKMRLLTNGLRGLTPQAALLKLQFHTQHGRIFVEKLIKQGMANAVNNFKLPKEKLIIKTVEVNEGPRIKRMDKSHSARFDRGVIQKRSSRLKLVLAEKEEPVVETPKIEKEKIEVTNKDQGGTRPPSLKLRRVNGTKS